MVESNYDILGIVEGTTEKEIRDAFRRLALQFHSDRGGENEQFIKIKQAYDDLKIGKKYPDTDIEKIKNSRVYSDESEEDVRRKNQILGQELSKEMKTAEEWVSALNRSNATATRLFGSKTLGEIELERKATGTLSIKGNFMAGSLTYDGPIIMQGSITSPSWTQEFKTNIHLTKGDFKFINPLENKYKIENGARIADIGGEEIVKNIRVGQSELEIAIAGRDKMEREIAKTYPDAEYMDTWVWFQSGINTDGAHNPKTNRKLVKGDILSLNTFPMISGYYTALERTLFLDHADDNSLKAWEANVKVHKRGLELIKPGVKCSDICHELNELFAELGYLHYRTFGYGHSFGVLSHFYGREAGLELREDIDTVLEENMVISMEPMIMIPEGNPGAGGYREHDILVIGKDGAENITKFPFGPEHNIIKN